MLHPIPIYRLPFGFTLIIGWQSAYYTFFKKGLEKRWNGIFSKFCLFTRVDSSENMFLSDKSTAPIKQKKRDSKNETPSLF